MKKLLFLVVFLVGCGTEYLNQRSDPKSPKDMNWKVIGQVFLKAEVDRFLALQQTEVITYVSATTNGFSADVSSIVLTESANGEVLDLGSVTLDLLKVNQLNQCGVGNDEKCTSAIVRVYTTAVTGHNGVAGFVNKDESYGVSVLAGEGSATESVGLTDANAAIVDTYTIPANDNKLTVGDFNGVTYELEVDFSNAGAGSYEMNLVIELAVGS